MSKELRIAMLGMIPGNGHPYSWSALLNGYDKARMAQCPYPVIAHHIFRRLGHQEAQRLARHRGLTLPVKEDYSLAEIFNESVAGPPEEKIVGFAA